MIKNTINFERQGRVLSWEKHQNKVAQHELEAAIRGERSLPKHKVEYVHNFQDILRVELDGYLPGSAYLRQRNPNHLPPIHDQPKKLIQCKNPFR